MSKFQKISCFLVYILVFSALVFSTSSCYSGRVGCPITAERGFGPGR